MSAKTYASFVLAPVEIPEGQPPIPFYNSSVRVQRALLPLVPVALAAGLIVFIVQVAKGEISLKELSSEMSSEIKAGLEEELNAVK